jgi:hypothetical protein
MTEKPQTNLRILKRTRIKPKTGDIFVFQLIPLPDRYFFGRVVKTDTRIGNCDDVILIYIYKTTSPNKKNIPELKLSDLMLPPMGVSASLWKGGYFETVHSDENHNGFNFAKHCFKSNCPPNAGLYFDEYGNRITEPFEPCGEWGMALYKKIDHVVSLFMGIPLVS